MGGRAPTTACRLEHVPTALLPTDPGMYWQLTDHEHSLIAQLTHAYSTGTQSGQTYVRLSSPLCGEEAQMTASRMAADMVSFFAAVPDFSAMRPRDQAALLSANSMPLFLLRNAFAASLHTPDDDNDDDDGLEALDSARLPEPEDNGVSPSQRTDLSRRLNQFQRSLRPFLRNDMATAAILQCAVVFDTRAAGLWDRQTVNSLQDKYIILMKHYIESQCSYLFCWHYVEAMLALVQQCEELAVSLLDQFHGWTAIVDPLIQRLTAHEAGHG